MTIQILKTKLYIPPLHPNLVPRRDLVGRLQEGLKTDRKLTLVSAPAGYGKTTLLSEWVHSEPERPVAWLSLDERDNDSTRFWTYVIAALQATRPNLGQTALAMLESTTSATTDAQPMTEPILTTLINDIASGPAADNTTHRAPVLVLDDYYLIEVAEIHDAVTFLIEHLPPASQGLHLVISSRIDPPFPLSRWRGQGQMSELRVADLRFKPEETTVLLNQVMDLRLSAKDVAALEERTEGWIVGLRMVALSLQRRNSRWTTEFVSTFTASHRYVLDYLLDEVLLRQPEGIQSFLLHTAILDRLSGPLCDAVRFGWEESPADSREAAVPGSDSSQAILARLEEMNLFIVPLDGEQRWYRYHHLFADLLRKRLSRQDPTRISMLHQRASRWYEEASLLEEAITHALAGKNLERVADLAERAALQMLIRGKAAIVPEWLDTLPREMIQARPQLCVYYAWTQYWIGRGDQGEAYLRCAEEAVGAPPSAEERRLAGHIAAVQAFYATVRRDTPRMLELAHLARQLLPRGDYMRTLSSIPLSVAVRDQGDIEAIEQIYSEASADAQAFEHPFLAITLLCYLGATQTRQGRLHLALQTYSQALELAMSPDGQELPPAGPPKVYLGLLALEWNDIETAKAMILTGVELCTKWRQASNLLDALGALALLRLVQRDWAGALDALHQGEQVARGIGRNLDQVFWLNECRVRLWLAQGNIGSAVRWAQRVGLDANDEPSYLHQLHHITLARILLAQGAQSQARLEDAAKMLARLLSAAEAAAWVQETIEISILQALAFQAQGDTRAALTALERALSLAKPGGYVRIFVNEGAPMARLLYRAAENSVAPDYVSQLLAVIDAETRATPDDTASQLAPIEPLSRREIDVLELIAEGLTNYEIADRLFIAPGTVKKHTSNIYTKLNVRNRSKAAAAARLLGIIS